MAKKTVCPITRADFTGKAKPVMIRINDEEIPVPVKVFSTGSLGWYLNRKVEIDVGGVKVPVQVGLNLTIVGSKELPQDAPPAHAPQTAHATGQEGHGAPALEAHATHGGEAHQDHGHGGHS